MTRSLPSPDLLRTLINYDSVTGMMTWLPRGQVSFDAKLAGKPAFAQRSGNYLIGRLGGVNLKAHRVAWALHYGEWPHGLIDHVDGNPMNNAISNLRCVSGLENAQNQGIKRTNSSGEMCISWFKRYAKWQVKITVNHKQKHIGFFAEMDEAIVARDKAWAEHGFHENHGRRHGAKHD